MWAWQVKMTSIIWVAAVTVAVIPAGGSALPTLPANDRPIIGILAQEVHGSLADALAKILDTGDVVKVFSLDTGRLSTTTSPKYHVEPLTNNPEGSEELSSEPEELEPQESVPVGLEPQDALKSGENGATGNEMGTETAVVVSSSPELEGEDPEGSSTQGESLFGTSQTRSSLGEVEPTTTTPPPVSKNSTYIGASYVKFIEAGGARVVPVFINKDRDYYEHIMKSINGILFPGGALPIDESSGYGRAGKIIYEIAKDMNDEGEVFPLWGTCLGFEMLMGLAAHGKEIRAECDALNTANRIKLDRDYADGYLLRHLPKRLIKALTTEPITSNFHQYCLTPKNFTTFGVDKTFKALAYSADRRGVEYIAAAEAWNYPFFAVQFHPEKSPYEWTTKPGHNHIPHSSVAIDTANHFAQVFVNYARRSTHTYADPSEESRSLIYNYSPVYTGQYSSMEQIYLF